MQKNTLGEIDAQWEKNIKLSWSKEEHKERTGGFDLKLSEIWKCTQGDDVTNLCLLPVWDLANKINDETGDVALNQKKRE